MADCTPTPLRSDVISNQLRKFIDGGNLARIILSQQIPLFEKMLFVDWGKKPSTCRILYAGLEPNGYTNIQRDVIALEYNIVVSRIIRPRFPFVTTVYAMKHDDEDFNEVVESHGGKVLYPSFWTEPIGPMEAMKQFGDRHPLIESSMKNACAHPSTTIQFAFSPPKTTPAFFDAYYLCWFLMPTTRVITVDGRLLMGVDEILAGQDKLPDALDIIRLPNISGDMQWGIVCEDASFFSDSKFKICEFNN